MQPIPFHTVQELEQYLQTRYSAAAIEPVDYLLYNARQQLLNLFTPRWWASWPSCVAIRRTPPRR